MNKNFIKNFIKGSMSTSVGQVATIGFHFLSIMIMTRNISKEGFGLYFLILTISFLFQKFSSLGLELTLVKFTAAKESSIKNSGVFIPVLFLRTVQLVIVSLVFISLNDTILSFFGEKISGFTFSIILIFSLGSYRELFFNLLQGLKKYKVYAIAQVLSAITKLLLIIFIIETSNLTIENLIYVEIISYSLTILVQIVFTPFSGYKNYEFSQKILKEILQFSLPLYLNNILTVINDRVNIFIIAAYLNPASIANFEVAKKIPDAFSRMFQSFIVVYFPNISFLFSQNKHDDALKLLNKSKSFFTIGILFMVSVSLLFQDEIVTLIFSGKYITASFAFVLLMFTFLLRTISNLLGYSLVAAGYSSVPVKVNSVTSIINIGAGVILIPSVGFIGAVYALLIMNGLTLLLNYLFLVKYNIHAKISNFLKPLIPFIILNIIYYQVSSGNMGFKIALLIAYLTLSLVIAKDFRNLISIAFRSLRKS